MQNRLRVVVVFVVGGPYKFIRITNYAAIIKTISGPLPLHISQMQGHNRQMFVGPQSEYGWLGVVLYGISSSAFMCDCANLEADGRVSRD